MRNTVKMTWDEFENQFQPKQSHINKRQEFNGWLYETFDEDLAYVMRVMNNKVKGKTELNVWTIVDTDGVMSIGNGFHVVNRVGYVITKHPAVEGVEYEIIDQDDIDFPIESLIEGNLLSMVYLDLEDICMVQEDANDVPEWTWIKENASFTHWDGIECVLNLANSFENIPESMQKLIEIARQRKVSYMLVSVGG